MTSDVESLFSHTNSSFSTPRSSKYDIPPLEPEGFPSSKPIPSAKPCTSSANLKTNSIKKFNVIETDKKYLKIKMYYNRDYILIKLRKAKLKSIKDLENVIRLKIPKYEKLSIYFQNESIKPVPLNNLMDDLILDYILTKDKIFINVQ